MARWASLTAQALFFLTEVQSVYNAVSIAGVQHSASAIHEYTYIRFHTLFHHTLLQAIKYGSLCSTV